MKTIDKILHLIETGDATLVLADANIKDILNELLKHDMIDLKDGQVLLTTNGKEARKKGFQVVAKQLRNRKRPGK